MQDQLYSMFWWIGEVIIIIAGVWWVYSVSKQLVVNTNAIRLTIIGLFTVFVSFAIKGSLIGLSIMGITIIGYSLYWRFAINKEKKLKELHKENVNE